MIDLNDETLEVMKRTGKLTLTQIFFLDIVSRNIARSLKILVLQASVNIIESIIRIRTPLADTVF